MLATPIGPWQLPDRGEMADDPQPRNSSEPPLGLDGFHGAPEDQGLSLERLSQAFARAMGQGKVPYEDESLQAADAADSEEVEAERRDEDGQCQISPRSIVEAILFVGHPENQPLSSRMIAALMRGVPPQEVDEIISQLNETYRLEEAPYFVAAVGSGYRLQLREEFSPVRERFFGRLRRARLSQAAIDVLAIVAYSQPVDRHQVDRLRGRPSGAVLRQLVQRDLLRIERDRQQRRRILYVTTERFLDLFGLDDLNDLPRHHRPELLE